MSTFVPQTVFGNIAVAAQIEYAVRDLLREWFPTYLREIERQMSWEGEPLPTPRNYTNRNSFDAQPGEEIPKVVVISPGLVSPPEHPESRGGYYRAIWQIGVGIATAAMDEETADHMVKMYGAAARGIVMQHQSIDGHAIGAYWIDERYDDLPIENQTMTFKSASLLFGIEIEEAVSRWKGPAQPGELPELSVAAETVIVEVPDWDTQAEVP